MFTACTPKLSAPPTQHPQQMSGLFTLPALTLTQAVACPLPTTVSRHLIA